MNLMESYKNRLQIAESLHKQSHNGAPMSAQKKLVLANALNNISKFMNESMITSTAATQPGAVVTSGGAPTNLGDFKRFCLNVATAALPNLIIPELMIVHPMTSIAGFKR